ncbi:hypothetical protein C2G38_2180572 [Gigaspora rosea]|uniref:Uncharacterized protein n=1 Tax=Gigaspora rosea TaxID=44941 RepID=A0A397VJ55_9GLOM|nr:hypothetical protein C2G38_2180572 [Gigaspora rosea]
MLIKLTSGYIDNFSIAGECRYNQRGRRRGSHGRGSRGSRGRELGGHERGSKERESHEEESQHENELDTNRDCGVGGYKRRNRRSHKEIQYENKSESNRNHEISGREIGGCRIGGCRIGDHGVNDREIRDCVINNCGVNNQRIGDRDVSNHEIDDRRIGDYRVSDRRIGDREINNRSINNQGIGDRDEVAEVVKKFNIKNELKSNGCHRIKDHGKGSKRKESYKENQRKNEREVIAEPFISNNEFNDIDSNYEEIESDIALTMQIYESMIDSELYDILTIKSPVRNRNKNSTQQQDKQLLCFKYIIINRLDHYQENYKKQAKDKEQQKNNINDDNDDNEVVESYKQKTGIPKALKDMTNIFEVCQYLVLERPDVLATANQMKNAMNTLLNSSTTTVPQSATSNNIKPVTSNDISEDKGLARLWHEEIKCLFLRCRNPSTGAIESLITEIFKYELYSNEAVEIIVIQSEEQQMLIPSRTDINEFITQEVVKQVLKRYLSGTNIDRLKRCGTMNKLVTLIRETFKICFNAYSTKAIKELDYITIDCKIPSRSGKNIVSRLSIPNSLV